MNQQVCILNNKGKKSVKPFFILFALITAPVQAGIYTWTDENGNVHFGDAPADEKSAVELNIRTNNQTGIANSSGNTAEREYLLKRIEKEKAAEQKKQKKQVKKDKKYKKLCKRYRSRLQVHLQTNRTYTMSPDGERTYYTDEQREQKKKKIEKGISKYCH